MGIALLDRFTGADSALVSEAESKQSYAHLNSSTWRYENNRLWLGGANSGAESMITTNLGDIGDVTAVANITTSATRYDIGLMIRQLNDQNFLLLQLFGGNVLLYKRNAGTWTVLGQYNAIVTTGTTYNVRMEQKGAVIDCYINGTRFITYTLSSAEQTQYLGSTYTNVGIRQHYTASGSSDDGGSRVDDWVVLGSKSSYGMVY